MTYNVINKHFEDMRGAVKDSDAPLVKQHEILAELGSMRVMTNEYMREKKHEAKQLDDGDALYKDKPPINLFKNIPKRKGGFIDALHSVEYQISKHAEGVLATIIRSGMGDAAKEEVLTCFRAVLEALDDQGVMLGQMKTFAAKRTMPGGEVHPEGDNRLVMYFSEKNMEEADKEGAGYNDEKGKRKLPGQNGVFRKLWQLEHRKNDEGKER